MDLQSSIIGSIAINSFGNTSISPDQWILPSVQPQHIYSHLLDCTLVPLFPFSLSVGDIASVNGIHQWPVIKWWNTMFDLNTSIRIVGHVLIIVCVKDLPAWCHSTYSNSLIMPVFMRFQFSYMIPVYVRYLQPLWISWSIVYLQLLWRSWPIVYLHHGDSDLLYIVRGDDHICHILYIMPIHGHCTLMYSWMLYVFAVICKDICTILLDGWFFHLAPHPSTSRMDL